MRWIAPLLVAVLAASGAPAQTRGVSSFEGLDATTSWCQSYQPSLSLGTHPSCTWNTTAAKLGHLRYVETGSAHDIATTQTKGAHVSVGTGKVYRRGDTTAGPPDCTEPCFTYQDSLASAATCLADGLANFRGLDVGSSWAVVNDLIRGYSTSERPSGTPTRIIQAFRPDLVTWSQMQVDGFSLSFLVATPQADFDAVETFLGGSGAWNWSERGWSTSWRDRDQGVRISDQITALGGNPKGYAMYLTRPTVTPVSPDAAVADLSISSYRTWLLARAQAVMAESGADLLALEHKFAQRTQPNGGGNYYVLDADNCGAGDTVANFLAGTCGAVFTEGGFTGDVEAAGYTWADYIQGLAAFAADLRASGIKYRFASNGSFLSSSPSNYYDDPSTSGVNENTLVSEIVYGASLVWITDGQEALEAELRTELAKRGVPWVNGDCGSN